MTEWTRRESAENILAPDRNDGAGSTSSPSDKKCASVDEFLDTSIESSSPTGENKSCHILGGADVGAHASFEGTQPDARFLAEKETQQQACMHSMEQRLLDLHKAEATCRDRNSSQFVAEFADLFVRLRREVVPHIRAVLDSGLVFRPDGRAADLRSTVFEDLDKDRRMRVLTTIFNSCPPPEPGTRGFVVMSDVDDTLFPASDVLHIGGCDRSWHLDGRLYPGVSRLHRELRGGLRNAYGGDYSVLLTARPPFMVKTTAEKTRRLSGIRDPRLSILPGSKNTMDAGKNFFKILAGRFTQMSELKVMRLLEYSALFPDYAGRFVFIGDDGQGDFDAATDMLTLKESPNHARARKAAAQPLVAFVAMHAVQQQKGGIVSPAVRHERVAKLRARNPAVPVGQSIIPGPAGAVRHRFFYFDDYMDLAEQLTSAGWLEPEQRDAVMEAFVVDNYPDPRQEAVSCNFLALRAALRVRRSHLSEADEAEVEAFFIGERSLPAIQRAHLRLAALPSQCTSLTLRILSVTFAEGISAPTYFPIVFHNIQEKNSPGFQLEADSNGVINLRWPCDAICHSGSRAVIDVGFFCRCFVVLDEESEDALRNQDACEVSLVIQGSEPYAERPVGTIVIKVFWV